MPYEVVFLLRLYSSMIPSVMSLSFSLKCWYLFNGVSSNNFFISHVMNLAPSLEMKLFNIVLPTLNLYWGPKIIRVVDHIPSYSDPSYVLFNFLGIYSNYILIKVTSFHLSDGVSNWYWRNLFPVPWASMIISFNYEVCHVVLCLSFFMRLIYSINYLVSLKTALEKLHSFCIGMLLVARFIASMLS